RAPIASWCRLAGATLRCTGASCWRRNCRKSSQEGTVTATNFEEDEILGKAYDGRLMRRPGGFLGPSLRRAVAAAGAAVRAAAARACLVRQGIDGPIAAGDVAGVAPIFAMYIGALLLAFACRYGQTYIMQSTGQRVMVDIRMRIFSHIQQMSLAFFDRNPVGR